MASRIALELQCAKPLGIVINDDVAKKALTNVNIARPLRTGGQQESQQSDANETHCSAAAGEYGTGIQKY